MPRYDPNEGLLAESFLCLELFRYFKEKNESAELMKSVRLSFEFCAPDVDSVDRKHKNYCMVFEDFLYFPLKQKILVFAAGHEETEGRWENERGILMVIAFSLEKDKKQIKKEINEAKIDFEKPFPFSAEFLFSANLKTDGRIADDVYSHRDLYKFVFQNRKNRKYLIKKEYYFNFKKEFAGILGEKILKIVLF